MGTHLRKQTKDGVNYLTEEEVCERIGVPSELMNGAGWPDPDVIFGTEEHGLLYREDDIEEFLARPDIGRPDRRRRGRPFIGGKFDEDGPRLSYLRHPFKHREKKLASKTQPEDFLGLIDEVMQQSVHLMRPYYPESDELTVALVLTIADITRHSFNHLQSTGPEEGWKRSHLPWCEVSKDTLLDTVYLRTKNRLEVDRWLDPDPLLARWVAIREMGDLLDRTMAAALHHCSDDPDQDGVGLHVWVGTPRMPPSIGMSTCRTVRGWTRRNGISTNT